MYGLNEYASLDGINLEVAAKLDTGAKTASLSARDIKRFKRNGESWVRFYRPSTPRIHTPSNGRWRESARSSAAPATTIRKKASSTPPVR